VSDRARLERRLAELEARLGPARRAQERRQHPISMLTEFGPQRLGDALSIAKRRLARLARSIGR
jgi:hypothetical protein